jgi:hypothetical protein
MGTLKRCLQAIVILFGFLVQAVTAMVFLKLYPRFTAESMPPWYPWLAYFVGGGLGGGLYWMFLHNLSQRFHVEPHEDNAQG